MIAVVTAPIATSRQRTLASGRNLKSAAKRRLVPSTDTTKCTTIPTIANSSRWRLLVSAVSAVLATSDTRSRKPKLMTMATERSLTRMKWKKPLPLVFVIPQIALRPSCSSTNTAMAPMSSVTPPATAAKIPSPLSRLWSRMVAIRSPPEGPTSERISRDEARADVVAAPKQARHGERDDQQRRERQGRVEGERRGPAHELREVGFFERLLEEARDGADAEPLPGHGAPIPPSRSHPSTPDSSPPRRKAAGRRGQARRCARPSPLASSALPLSGR